MLLSCKDREAQSREKGPVQFNVRVNAASEAMRRENKALKYENAELLRRVAQLEKELQESVK